MDGKRWIVVGAVVVIAVVGFSGWWFISGRQGTIAEAQASMDTAVVQKDTLAVTVEGAGSLVPRAEVSLAFLSSGQVAEILVEEGQAVEVGQPLVRLETDELALQVARAEAALASAEGQLAQLSAPPQSEEVAAQEANLAAAQGQVSAAVANRDQVTAGPSDSQVAAAEAQVAAAEMDYRAALRTYDSIDKHDEDRKEQARYDLWASEVALGAAQTQLDVLLAGANADEVRAAEASVTGAVAQRDAAQAQLDLLLAGAAEEQIRSAEAAVAQAGVALEQARLTLQRATLTASMDGIVTALNVGLGEMVNPGQPVVVLSDLTGLEVDVSLDETDAARLSVGQEARVSVDAFPDVEMTGEVTYVAPRAAVSSGVVLYPVTIGLLPSDLPVRAGMTVDVGITTASQENALIVPLRAIHAEGDHVYVDRLVERQPGAGSETGQRVDVQIERVEVTLGMTTDTKAEITSGLAPGDVVLVVAAPVQGDEPQLPGPFRMLRGEN